MRGVRRRWLLAAVAVVALLALASARLFIWPAKNSPERADAVVVLGGRTEGVPQGLEMAREGYAPNVLISAPDSWDCPAGPPGVAVSCFRPTPFSTQGEARYVGALARARRWKRIIVVSTVPQDTRARLRIKRCFDGQVLIVPVEPPSLGAWVYDVAYEWGALAKALVWQRAC